MGHSKFKLEDFLYKNGQFKKPLLIIFPIIYVLLSTCVEDKNWKKVKWEDPILSREKMPNEKGYIKEFINHSFLFGPHTKNCRQKVDFSTLEWENGVLSF